MTQMGFAMPVVWKRTTTGNNLKLNRDNLLRIKIFLMINISVFCNVYNIMEKLVSDDQ